jgi:hypothetical protein
LDVIIGFNSFLEESNRKIFCLSSYVFTKNCPSDIFCPILLKFSRDMIYFNEIISDRADDACICISDVCNLSGFVRYNVSISNDSSLFTVFQEIGLYALREINSQISDFTNKASCEFLSSGSSIRQK